MEALVKAVRADERVGVGSCTSIDECYTDEELAQWFAEEGITTPEAAVAAAHEREGLRLEAALNARCGEDDDPQLAEWRAWQAKEVK